MNADMLITKMHNDLKGYAEKKNANLAVVKAREFFIDQWQTVVMQYEQETEMHCQDIQRLLKEVITLKNQILKLEAICLIHGIDDLPFWMAKSFDVLADDVRINQKFDLMQFPSRLLDNEAWQQFYQEQMNKIITEKN